MGSHSYIAEGLENPDSFKSCSHGAGRAMGRKAAIRDLPAEAQAEEMRERDIKLFGGGRGSEWVAESKLAYKAIDEVMDNQKDLVRPVIKLTPLAVLKA
jgi:tRNA-splicing ligase RtcB